MSDAPKPHGMQPDGTSGVPALPLSAKPPAPRRRAGPRSRSISCSRGGASPRRRRDRELEAAAPRRVQRRHGDWRVAARAVPARAARSRRGGAGRTDGGGSVRPARAPRRRWAIAAVSRCRCAGVADVDQPGVRAVRHGSATRVRDHRRPGRGHESRRCVLESGRLRDRAANHAYQRVSRATGRSAIRAQRVQLSLRHLRGPAPGRAVGLADVRPPLRCPLPRGRRPDADQPGLLGCRAGRHR